MALNNNITINKPSMHRNAGRSSKVAMHAAINIPVIIVVNVIENLLSLTLDFIILY